MTTSTEMLKFQIEFNSIQNLLNIIDVQHFKYGNQRNIQGKPTKLRFILVILKCISVATVATVISVDLLDMNQRIVIGSSLTAALFLVTLYFSFTVVISIVVQTYRASESIKLIYDNLNIVLLILKSFNIHFDFFRFRKRAIVHLTVLIILHSMVFFICDDIQKLLKFYLLFTLYPLLITIFFMYFYTFQVDLVNWQMHLLIKAINQILLVDTSRTKTIKLLRDCRKFFNAISNSVTILNNSFGFIIMEMFIYCVIIITFNGYKIVIAFKDVKERVIFYGKLELF